MILDYLNNHTRGLFWQTPYRPSGCANVFGVIDGKALAIQIKTPKKGLVQSQITFSENFRRAGGMYYVVRSMDDLKELAIVNAWNRNKTGNTGLPICGDIGLKLGKNRAVDTAV